MIFIGLRFIISFFYFQTYILQEIWKLNLRVFFLKDPGSSGINERSENTTLWLLSIDMIEDERVP